MDENLEQGYYDDTEILPTIDISDLSRKEVKNLARTVAGRENPNHGLTYKEVLTDKANIIGKFSRQEDRFKRLVNKQYQKNVRYTQQLERARRAAEGDVQAMQDYITNGTTEASKYVAPLVLAPGVASVATSGTLGLLAKGAGQLLSKGYIRWPLEALGAGDFIYRNATGQGFKKTATKFKEGDVWGGLGSASLDVLDSAGILGAGYDLYKISKLPKYIRQIGKTLSAKKRYKRAGDIYSTLHSQEFDLADKRSALTNEMQSKNLQKPELRATYTMKQDIVDTGSQLKTTALTLPNGKTINMETLVGNTGQGIKTYPVFTPDDSALATPVVTFGNSFGWAGHMVPDYRGPVGSNVVSGLRDIPLQVAKNPEFSQYLIDAQSTMGNSGIIGGSSVLFDRGYISGVPHDLEIISTKSRQRDLIQKIGFDEASATKLPLALASKSKVSAGEGLTDIQVIDEDPQGFAVGKLAHELYRVLHPEDHAEYLSALVKQNYNNPRAVSESFKLPKKDGGYYTANELLDEFLQSGAMAKKTLVDALSVAKTGSTYQQNPQKLMRPIGILSNTDPTLQPEILDAIHTLGKINLGKNYKTIRDLYPNIDFTDVAKNEEFLEALGFDKSLAVNPAAMENIAEYYHLQLSGSQRVYSNPKTPEDIEKFAYPTKDWGGGRAMGAGGNSTLGTDAAFEYPYRSMGQFPVLKKGDGVKSPLDILQAYTKIQHNTPITDLIDSSEIDKLKQLGLSIHKNTTLGDIDRQLASLNDEKITESAGEIMGINGVFGGDYGWGGISSTQYFGRYSKTPVASTYRLVTPNGQGKPSLNYEVGRLLHKYKANNGANMTPEETKDFANTMLQFFNDFLSGKITQQTGLHFSRGDYDELIRYQKQFEELQRQSNKIYIRKYKIGELANKYWKLAQKIDAYLRDTAIIGGTGLVAAGAGLLTKHAINTSRSKKYYDEFVTTDEYKDSYYNKLQQDPRFSYDSEYNKTKAEYKHIYEAQEELYKSAKEFGKKRAKEDRKAARKNFLKQFSEFQPNNLGYLMHGK